MFSGDNNIQIKTWIRQIEEMADVLKWDETGTGNLFPRTVFGKSWPDVKA